MISRPEKTADGDIQGLGGVLGEYHPLRRAAAKKFGQSAAKTVDPPGGGKGILMGTPPAVAPLIHGRRHGLPNGRGLGAGGGGIVQIDHGLMTRAAPASFSTMVYILVTLPTHSFSVNP